MAVIGASRTPGKVGYEVLSNLKGGGFEGQIIPVNPRATEVLGLTCYSAIADYGRPVDLTVIAVPAPAVADAVRSSLRTGTKAIIVLTAGFAESGSRGILMQAEIARLCAEAKVRLLGPNCLGVINTSHRLNASFSRYVPKAGGISVRSQSGALCTAVLDWAHAHDVGLAKVITNSGGPAVMAADALERSGLKLAKLDGRAMEKLKGELPSAAGTCNPIDMLGDADPKRYAAAVAAAQHDEAVDAVVVILTPHAMTQPSQTIQAVATQANGDKPLLLVFIGEPNGRRCGDGRLPVYSSPERAVAALHAMYEYRLWRSRPEYVITRFPVNRRRVERIITRHVRANRLRVGEVQTKDILRAYDLNVPDGAMANSPQEAVEVAERIGFPVVMKVVSADIVHKSDVGGVKLNIAGAEDVRDTFDLLTLRVGRRAPSACLDGVYVEKMCGHGLEVILGMTCDPRFGPLLVFGLGGTFVDRLKGLSCHLAPVTAEEALEMLSQTRSYAMLRGSLDQESIDVSAIIGGLQRISQLATDFPQVKELSIDPYLVGPVGTEAMVVDARMTLFATGNGR